MKQGWIGRLRRIVNWQHITFDRSQSNPVESGLLFVLGNIHRIANQAGVDFDHLMTMVAENDFSGLGKDIAPACSGIMDLIDDGLLSLHEDHSINPGSEGPEVWADKVFRSSLAAIQAERSLFSLDSGQLIQFISTRTRRILDLTPEPQQRKAYVSSDLPVSTASNVYRDHDQFLRNAQSVSDAGNNVQSVCDFLEWLEEWARGNAGGIIDGLPEKNDLDLIREAWISGRPMREILEATDAADGICKDAYGYQFPWLIHAAAQQIKQLGNEDLSETLAVIALSVELGVP